MDLHGEDDVVACPGVSLVTDQLAARLGIHISRGSMSTLERYNLFYLVGEDYHFHK